jgi:hypothetical protein
VPEVMMASIINGDVVSPSKSSLVWAPVIQLITGDYIDDGLLMDSAYRESVSKNLKINLNDRDHHIATSRTNCRFSETFSIIITKKKGNKLSLCLNDSEQKWEVPEHIRLTTLDFNDIIIQGRRWLLTNDICSTDDISNTYLNIIRLML